MQQRITIVDPLPSWSDGNAKQAILDFIARVTRDDGPDFVPPADRIATFDNDGTLWCEQPMQVQIFFAMDRLKQLARQDPSLHDQQPFKAFLERDIARIKALGKEGALTFATKTHAGVTAEEFHNIATEWLARARHPTLHRLFTENVYQPQIELLAFLRDSGFRSFIVSGGGIDLIRAFAEEKYGIPRDQVIGSSVKGKFGFAGDRAEVTKLAELDSFDDREAKPENIYLHIGRRPILAFGNSDGDLAMMRYATTGAHPGLALLLHHDDAEREFAYDRDFRLSPLVEALDKAGDYGITVVSMKRDWLRVFGTG
jgi:phosphoglycolate phosphatase-like HAD superfamily hydrolase